MASERALLLFARSPEAEAMAKGLSVPGASALFAALVTSWADAARRCGARLIVASPASSRVRLEGLLARWQPAFRAQGEGSFGDRLADSAQEAFGLGAVALLIAGGDCPAPSPPEIEAAFAALEAGRGRAVLGPAGDGGLFLIGIPAAHADLLRDIGPRDSGLFERMRASLLSLGVEVRVLDSISDIDAFKDLRKVRTASRREAAWVPFDDLLARALAPAAPPEARFRRPSGAAFADPRTLRGPPPPGCPAAAI